MDAQKQSDFINKIDELSDELIKDLSGLIRINSVQSEAAENAPYGKGVAEAFDYMLKLGEREGFRCVNVENAGGHMDFGPEDAEETMGILCHLDVVPEGGDWERDPFSGDVVDGIMYGRGTMDDKGPTMSAFYAVKALKDCGYVPKKKIRIILGLDEETGSTGMEIYKEHVAMPDFAIVPDSDFPLVHGEKGIMTFDLVRKFSKPVKGGVSLKKIVGGNAPNMVPDAVSALISCEEGYDRIKELAAEYGERTGHAITTKGRGKSLELSCTGISAHGAHPEMGENAITTMMDFLAALEFNCSEVNDFISFYNRHLAGCLDGEKMGCGLTDEISGKLVFNIGMIDLDTERIKLTVNVRIPISLSDEDVYAGMAPVIEPYDIGVVKKSYNPSLYFSLDNPMVQTLLAIYQRHTGDTQTRPLVIGGGTYAREMENAIAYGAMYPGDPDTMHQKNECVKVDRIIQTAKIYADAIFELAVK